MACPESPAPDAPHLARGPLDALDFARALAWICEVRSASREPAIAARRDEGRGPRRAPAPADVSKPGFNSVAAVVRLLTPGNRRLLALIRDRKPRSVAELVTMTGRAQANLTRTLAKFEAAGFITMKTVGRRKAPSAAVKKIVVEIDPYSDRDRLRVA